MKNPIIAGMLGIVEIETARKIFIIVLNNAKIKLVIGLTIKLAIAIGIAKKKAVRPLIIWSGVSLIAKAKVSKTNNNQAAARPERRFMRKITVLKTKNMRLGYSKDRTSDISANCPIKATNENINPDTDAIITPIKSVFRSFCRLLSSGSEVFKIVVLTNSCLMVSIVDSLFYTLSKH
jgi:hypothetical protein